MATDKRLRSTDLFDLLKITFTPEIHMLLIRIVLALAFMSAIVYLGSVVLTDIRPNPASTKRFRAEGADIVIQSDTQAVLHYQVGGQTHTVDVAMTRNNSEFRFVVGGTDPSTRGIRLEFDSNQPVNMCRPCAAAGGLLPELWHTEK